MTTTIPPRENPLSFQPPNPLSTTTTRTMMEEEEEEETESYTPEEKDLSCVTNTNSQSTTTTTNTTTSQQHPPPYHRQPQNYPSKDHQSSTPVSSSSTTPSSAAASSSTTTTSSRQSSSSLASRFFSKFWGNSSASQQQQQPVNTSSSSPQQQSIAEGGYHMNIDQDKIDEDEKRYKETSLVMAIPTSKKVSSNSAAGSALRDRKTASSTNLFVETNLEDYIFRFQNIFTDRTMFRSFYRYLETEHNTEPLEFISKVNELEFTYYKMMRMVRDLSNNNNNNNNNRGHSGDENTNSSSFLTRGHFSDLPKMVLGLGAGSGHGDKNPLSRSPSKGETTSQSPSSSPSLSEPITPRRFARKQLSFFGIGKRETKTEDSQKSEMSSAQQTSHSDENTSQDKSTTGRFGFRLGSSKKKEDNLQKSDSKLNLLGRRDSSASMENVGGMTESSPSMGDKTSKSPSVIPTNEVVSTSDKSINNEKSSEETSQEKQTTTTQMSLLNEIEGVTEVTEGEMKTSETTMLATKTETHDTSASLESLKPPHTLSLLPESTKSPTSPADTDDDDSPNLPVDTSNVQSNVNSQPTPRPSIMPKLNLTLIPTEPSTEEGTLPTSTDVTVSSEEPNNGLNRLMSVLKKEKSKRNATDDKSETLTVTEHDDEKSDTSSSVSRNSSEKLTRTVQHGFLQLPINTPRSKYENLMKLYKKQILLAIQLMKDFVEEESKKEINISSKDKKTFTNLFVDSHQYQNFDEWLLPQPPHMLFRTMKNSVMYELENDNFPRFVRSELWLKKLQHKGLTYLNKVGRVKEATYFPYTYDDFREPMVFDRDIDFMEYLARDDYQWKLLGSKREGAINVYKITEKVLMPNVSFYNKMQINKWSGVLNYPFDVVKQCCMPGLYVYKYDPNIASCEELGFWDYETLKQKYPSEKWKYGKRSVGIVRYGMVFPFPFKSKRSFLAACSAWYDKEEEKLTLIYKPCEHERYYKDGKGVNEGKKLIDIRDFQYYQIKKIDAYRTSLLQIHLLDVGGNARFAANMLRMDRAKGMMKGFNDYIRKHLNNIPKISEDDPVWKHVVTCMGRERAERLDMSATLYSDLKAGRNIRNKSLLATVKKRRKEKKKMEKLKNQQQNQLLDSQTPTSPMSSTMSSSSDDSKSTLARLNSSVSFGGQTYMTPEMALMEEEEAMMTVFDADLENFTMTGTTTDNSEDDYEEYDYEDGDLNENN
ncbi:hypothetical protein FDP41_005318 [Naegleria fowleri]|uniref:RGS domain-containing protein n=1 Tax=Naegleria fowleri TaxID=5763 RepID=A0A6A5BNZ3_NAEFO|nr:uncharacterized protein FDP41_005318 [Naegleria fowleri]KAF0975991.1 hypothetical protein FDP41_005318 [Naegleria fowleri]